MNSFTQKEDALRGTPNPDSILPVSERDALKVLPIAMETVRHPGMATDLH
jgi:hypothetical protein